MGHILSIDHAKCTGCRNCELACSIAHFHEFNPARSRIQILKDEGMNLITPMVCLQCEMPLCNSACPTGAIRYNEHGVLYVHRDDCIGCMSCVTACVYGGISIDPKTRKAMKCNLCWGTPACVKACEYRAIEYVPTGEAILSRYEGAKASRISTGMVREAE